jgi:hypothetical protein
MFVGPPSQSLRTALLCFGLGLAADGATAAPTAALAKKCAVLTQKAFPPRVVGNPAAGNVGGSGRSQQAYFNECIKNGGNVKDEAPLKGTGAQEVPAPASKRYFVKEFQQSGPSFFFRQFLRVRRHHRRQAPQRSLASTLKAARKAGAGHVEVIDDKVVIALAGEPPNAGEADAVVSNEWDEVLPGGQNGKN